MKTWRERIAEARERGHFTEEEYQDAQDWRTCAIGEQAHHTDRLKVRPVRWDSTSPTDPCNMELVEMGASFGGAVAVHKFDLAESLLDAIEDRVLQLKREAQP